MKGTTLNQLFALIKENVVEQIPAAESIEPVHRDFRPGDVRHALANAGKAEKLLGYHPENSIITVLKKTALWYLHR